MDWHYFKRRLMNQVGQALALMATLFTLFWLVWLLTTLISQGWQALDLSMFVKDTPAPGAEGGMRNAIVGSLMMRSEEHTSELQSRPHLVCRLLLEKKKTTK